MYGKNPRNFGGKVILISHRGNINGPNPDKENHPEYIEDALRAGFDVEVDVWKINGKFWLGHDKPQHEVSWDFLSRPGLWCHAKNVSALEDMITINAHCFWHENDTTTLTSQNFLWTYPGKQLLKRSICVMPESIKKDQDLSLCAGICSDFIEKYRK